MSLGRRLLPILGPLGIAVVLAADMNAAPMTRVLLLTREGRLAEALTVTHATAAITYPLAYAHVHARMRKADPALERELDDGLRMFCPGG